MPHRRLYRKVRHVTRSPHFWPAVQVCATIASMIALGVILYFSTTESAAREARIDADNRAAVTNCYNRNAQGPAAARFFSVLSVILRNQKTLARAGVVATNANPETVKQFRLVSKRASASLADLHSFAQLSVDNTPSRKECRALAVKLEVNAS